ARIRSTSTIVVDDDHPGGTSMVSRRQVGVRWSATLGLVLALGAEAVPARGQDPWPAALAVRLVRPDRQGERLLGWFEGCRAPHPAAALSGWRRATGGTVGKPFEAVIALFNPGMARELASLEQAEFQLGLGADGSTHWLATIPGDDGTVAALATALALTDG